VRDVQTGARQRSVPLWPGSGNAMVAYEGLLFSHDEPDNAGSVRPRVTDLSGDMGSARARDLPGRLVTLAGCGTMQIRLCVLTRTGDRTTVTAIDSGTREQAWQVTGGYDGTHLSSARGLTLLGAGGPFDGTTVFDTEGRSPVGGGETVSWLDPDNLLVQTAGNQVSRFTVSAGALTPLGALPDGLTGPCVSYGVRLACLGADTLRVMDVTG
jgi:hypothetical protein